MRRLFDSPLDLRVAGGPIRVHRGGDPEAPALVLLHGAMLDTGRGVWREVGPALAQDHHVHVIDLPRHGASRPWRGVLDDDALRPILLELLDRLDLPRAALIGLSMGGGLATGIALRHPERVEALVAVGPGGIGARRPAQLLTWAMLRTPGLLRASTLLLARSPRMIRRSLAGQLVAGEDTPGFEEILHRVTDEARAKQAHHERVLDDWQIHAYGPRSMRLDLLPELPRLQVPTLWMRGDRDTLVGPGEVAAAAAAAPGSQLVTIPDAGHIVTYDQPEAFLAATRAFLAEARSDREPA